MRDYIHDNADDEITRHQFLNAYLASREAPPANLNPFRTLMGSIATGVNRNKIGHRLTNLTRLQIDTSWWTRYRDDSPIQAIPIFYRRLRILRHSTSRPSNKVAAAFTQHWRKGLPMWKCCVS
jgi:hypothetical protein